MKKYLLTLLILILGSYYNINAMEAWALDDGIGMQVSNPLSDDTPITIQLWENIEKNKHFQKFPEEFRSDKEYDQTMYFFNKESVEVPSEHVTVPYRTIKNCSPLKNSIQRPSSLSHEISFSENNAQFFQKLKSTLPYLEAIASTNNSTEAKENIIVQTLSSISCKKNFSLTRFANYLNWQSLGKIFTNVLSKKMLLSSGTDKKSLWTSVCDSFKNKTSNLMKLDAVLRLAQKIENSDEYEAVFSKVFKNIDKQKNNLKLISKKDYSHGSSENLANFTADSLTYLPNGTLLIEHTPNASSIRTFKKFREQNTFSWVCPYKYLNTFSLPLNPGEMQYQFSPDGKFFTCIKEDPVIYFFSVKEQKHIKDLPTDHEYKLIQAHRFSPDGKLLATLGFNSIKIWDIHSEQCVCTLPGSLGDKIAFLDNTKIIRVSYSMRNEQSSTIRILDISSDSGILFDEIEEPSRMIHSIVYSPCKKLLFLTSHDKSIKVYNADPLELLYTIKDNYNFSTFDSLHISPNGKNIAVRHQDKKIDIFEILNTQAEFTLRTLLLLNYLSHHQQQGTVHKLPSEPLYFDTFSMLPKRFQDQFADAIDQTAFQAYCLQKIRDKIFLRTN